MEINKKRAAAIAAVTCYLNTEQEAAAMQAMAAQAVEQTQVAQAVEAAAAPPLKVWGISGRQAQMQMRNMIQMKTFK
jgi:hypothetical protein